MNDTNKQTKDVITGRRINRETIYYAALFTLALAASIVLLISAKVKNNKGLLIYSAILIPVFAICVISAVRAAYVSKNRMYVKGEVLIIKSFFYTRKIKINAIKRLTVTKGKKDGFTSIKLSLRDKTVRYSFKDFSKEDSAHLRNSISK